jgi:uncharacterized membrane protein (UPF0136 family)
MNNILGGIVVGLVSGVVVGLLTMVSDAVFYSKNGEGLSVARQYSNPLFQLGVFMAISLFYGAVQGIVFTWVAPILPTNSITRGILFGLISYLILSRHFVEGFAFMNPEVFPTKISSYLSIEFLVIYVLQGLIISKGITFWS